MGVDARRSSEGSAAVRRLALDSPTVSPGAACEPLDNGGFRVVTPTAAWANAVGFPVDADAGSAIFALVACRRGEVGVGLLARDQLTPVAPESIVVGGESRLINALFSPTGESARTLMIRNGAVENSDSECDVLAVFSGEVPSIELTEGEIALALCDPAAARESSARRIWPDEALKILGPNRVALTVRRPRAPLRLPSASELWRGPTEAVTLGAAEDLIKLLDDFQPDAIEPHIALLPPDSMRSYLRMNVVRIVRLVKLLQRRGLVSGDVLDVGAWFGSFALALQRLGYSVVACDRYSSYGHAFDSNVELLKREGVRVVSTTRESELDQIASVGQFDVVVAGAVIEHVPHTPRYLLETLFRAVRPGGILALDTPNVARYWNRQALERGETIFQPIEDQYWSEPPWEGHHREYTAAELKWMLEHVGCEDVEVQFLDYNMLQFEELSAEHIECLASIVEDPAQSDTLLAAGRRPISANASE